MFFSTASEAKREVKSLISIKTLMNSENMGHLWHKMSQIYLKKLKGPLGQIVVDRTSALSETSRTEFSAILCQKVRPKFGQSKLLVTHYSCCIHLCRNYTAMITNWAPFCSPKLSLCFRDMIFRISKNHATISNLFWLQNLIDFDGATPLIA